MEHSIQESLTEAVSELCNCTFTTKFLRNGEFRCWDSPTEVTYRSTVVSTPTHASSHIISFIESWVESNRAVVRRRQVVHRVESRGCAVGVSSLEAEECVAKEEGKINLSPVSNDDPEVNQNCVATNGTNGCGN